MTQPTHRPELPDERIQGALRGDRGDLDALVEHYWPVVLGAVAARMRRTRVRVQERDELVQAVWLELLADGCKRLRYYQPGRGSFGYFVRLMAVQITGRQLSRRRGIYEPFEDGRTWGVSVDELERRLLGRNMLDRFADLARERLSDADLKILRGIYIMGLKPGELAEESGTKVTTISQQHYRFKKKIDEIAQELLDTMYDSGRPATGSRAPLSSQVIAYLAPALLWALDTSDRCHDLIS